ncbi:MAG: thermonuclease family protein [Proteobacteria bacterium]|nr:thermonuclease family protein [Pseudomonadota bacterium]
MRRTFNLAGIAYLLAGAGAVFAQTAPQPWRPLAETAHFETGDSWLVENTRYRLYGVQACLRGTTFTNASGQKRDCGEAGLAMLVGLVRDLKPMCTPVLESAHAGPVLVTCLAFPKTGKAAGSRIDVGTALIASGFAFAALKPDGKPVHLPYFVAELDAKRAKSGLWAFPDLPEPNAIIFKAIRDQQARSGNSPVGVRP